MTAVEAPDLALGQDAPDFSCVPGVDGRRYSLSSFDDADLVVLVFLGNGCPTAKSCEERLVDLQAAYGPRGVRLVAVNANSSYLSPPDTLAAMARRAEQRDFSFPYLKDEGGVLARACGATRTPEAFVFDRTRAMRYRGRVFDARDPARVRRRDLQEALDDLLVGRPVRVPETEAFGCSIVW
jgi:peroxiredoxin